MLQRIARAYTKRWGTAEAKRRAWDSEYRAGQWTYDKERNDEGAEPLYPILERFSECGGVLDLGCGSGMTALEMKNNFRAYAGVDISAIAVSTARARLAAEPDRADKVRFFESDIATFSPDSRYDAILFRESMYYVPGHAIRNMLLRYSGYLTPGGVIIVRLCDTKKYRHIVSILGSLFQLTEAFADGRGAMSVFVCSTRSGTKTS